jgi:hypothetical protein
MLAGTIWCHAFGAYHFFGGTSLVIRFGEGFVSFVYLHFFSIQPLGKHDNWRYW